jgi:hypothetical protein
LGILRVGARRVLRLIPGAGAFVGAIANARATDEMVTRRFATTAVPLSVDSRGPGWATGIMI